MESTTDKTISRRDDEFDAIYGALAYVLMDIKRRHINLSDLNSHSKRAVSCLPLIDGISSNMGAALTLYHEGYDNEVHIIARSIIERVITFLYLQCCSEEEVDRYLHHTFNKKYRKLSSEFDFKDGKFIELSHNKINLDKNPDLKRIVDMYTGKKSKKEVTRWSNTSLITKINVIEKSKKIDLKEINILLINLAVYYDDASEALHGTFYGCTFHLGLLDIGPGVKATDDRLIASFDAYMKVILGLIVTASSVVSLYLGNMYKQDNVDVAIKNLREEVRKKAGF